MVREPSTVTKPPWIAAHPLATRGIRSSISCEVFEGYRVHLRAELDLPLPHALVWAVAADLPRFLTIDPFHESVEPEAPVLGLEGGFILVHRVLGVRFRRRGRMLRLEEGRGYALSDHSARGPDRGFPHVFVFTVEPLVGELRPRTRLGIEVKGKWTARWMPRCVVRQWLLAVAREHARLLGEEFSKIGGRSNGC
jgi:hypothetical protein